MTAATPAPCPCGAASDWEAERDGKYYISCSVPGCWIGPSAETKAEAIAAWNRVAGQGWQPINTARRGEEPLILARFDGSKMEWITAAEWGWQSLGYIQRASWSGWFVETPAIVEDPMKRRWVKLYGTIHQDAYGENGPTHWRPPLAPPVNPALPCCQPEAKTDE